VFGRGHGIGDIDMVKIGTLRFVYAADNEYWFDIPADEIERVHGEEFTPGQYVWAFDWCGLTLVEYIGTWEVEE
jgi:hypothetical protein